VLKLPATAFLNVFKEYPECMVRIIQVSSLCHRHVEEERSERDVRVYFRHGHC
jgi:hypothetical protein